MMTTPMMMMAMLLLPIVIITMINNNNTHHQQHHHRAQLIQYLHMWFNLKFLLRVNPKVKSKTCRKERKWKVKIETFAATHFIWCSALWPSPLNEWVATNSHSQRCHCCDCHNFLLETRSTILSNIFTYHHHEVSSYHTDRCRYPSYCYGVFIYRYVLCRRCLYQWL